MQKPDGLTILHLNELIQRLSVLKPRDFPGVGARMEERLHAHGCFTAEQMFMLPLEEMITIWGGIVGERFFHLIRGHNLIEEESERGSISHSKVLPPDARTLEAAWPVAIRLLTKACVRLRSEGFYAKELLLSLKFVERDPAKRKWQQKSKCLETQDSLQLVEELERMWRHVPARAILQVGVVLTGLVAASHHQLSLFEDKKREALMSTLDAVNGRYRDSTVYVADAHAAMKVTTNAIAFQRIPGEEE
jgi:DNA polymerase-4